MLTHLISEAVPSPTFSMPRSSARSQERASSPLSAGKRGVRSTSRLQIPSWNPGQLRGDHAAVANHISGPWHINCLQEGAVFDHPTLQHRLHVVTAHHRATLLDKDTFCEDVRSTPIFVPAKGNSDRAGRTCRQDPLLKTDRHPPQQFHDRQQFTSTTDVQADARCA